MKWFIKIAFAIKLEADDMYMAETCWEELIELCKKVIEKNENVEWCKVEEHLIDACDFEEETEEYEWFL